MYEERAFSQNWLLKRALNRLVRMRLAGIGGVVLDLGCGNKPFEPDIAGVATHYFGVDWSNTLHGLHCDVVADLNRELPFADGMVDHVVSFEVLEHLAEPQTMLREAARVLRSGGGLTMSTPFQWWEHESPWDYQRFTRHGLRYQLERAGFTDIDVVPTTGFWGMWLLKLNYQLARLVRGPRWMRNVVRALLVPVWWTNQVIGGALDRLFPDARESVGYFVTARKP